jgi:hypothetical protein
MKTSLRSVTKLGVAAAAVALFAGCVDEATDEDLGSSVQSIIGGTVTTARPAVGKVTYPNGKSCTAVLISAKTFLTAGTCIGRAPYYAGGTFTSPAGTFAVQWTLAQHNALGIYDLAYGRLVADSGIAPSAVSSSQPSYTWLSVLGYGCTSRAITCAIYPWG